MSTFRPLPFPRQLAVAFAPNLSSGFLALSAVPATSTSTLLGTATVSGAAVVPSVRQTASITSVTGTIANYAAVFSSATLPGSMLVALMGSGSATATLGTDTADTWTALEGGPVLLSSTIEMWYVASCVGGKTTYTFTRSTSGTGALVLMEVINAASVAPFDGSTHTTGTTSTTVVTGTSAATTQASELWIAGFSGIYSAGLTAGTLGSVTTGYALDVQAACTSASATNCVVGLAHEVVAATGSPSASATLSTTPTKQVGFIVAFKAVTAAQLDLVVVPASGTSSLSGPSTSQQNVVVTKSTSSSSVLGTAATSQNVTTVAATSSSALTSVSALAMVATAATSTSILGAAVSIEAQTTSGAVPSRDGAVTIVNLGTGASPSILVAGNILGGGGTAGTVLGSSVTALASASSTTIATAANIGTGASSGRYSLLYDAGAAGGVDFVGSPSSPAYNFTRGSGGAWTAKGTDTGTGDTYASYASFKPPSGTTSYMVANGNNNINVYYSTDQWATINLITYVIPSNSITFPNTGHDTNGGPSFVAFPYGGYIAAMAIGNTGGSANLVWTMPCLLTDTTVVHSNSPAAFEPLVLTNTDGNLAANVDSNGIGFVVYNDNTNLVVRTITGSAPSPTFSAKTTVSASTTALHPNLTNDLNGGMWLTWVDSLTLKKAKLTYSVGTLTVGAATIFGTLPSATQTFTAIREDSATLWFAYRLVNGNAYYRQEPLPVVAATTLALTAVPATSVSAVNGPVTVRQDVASTAATTVSTLTGAALVPLPLTATAGTSGSSLGGTPTARADLVASASRATSTVQGISSSRQDVGSVGATSTSVLTGIAAVRQDSATTPSTSTSTVSGLALLRQELTSAAATTASSLAGSVASTALTPLTTGPAVSVSSVAANVTAQQNIVTLAATSTTLFSGSSAARQDVTAIAATSLSSDTGIATDRQDLQTSAATTTSGVIGTNAARQDLVALGSTTSSSVSGLSANRQDVTATRSTATSVLSGTLTARQDMSTVAASSSSTLVGTATVPLALSATPTSSTSILAGTVTGRQDAVSTPATSGSTLVGTATVPIALSATPSSSTSTLAGTATSRQDAVSTPATSGSTLVGTALVTLALSGTPSITTSALIANLGQSQQLIATAGTTQSSFAGPAVYRQDVTATAAITTTALSGTASARLDLATVAATSLSTASGVAQTRADLVATSAKTLSTVTGTAATRQDLVTLASIAMSGLTGLPLGQTPLALSAGPATSLSSVSGNATLRQDVTVFAATSQSSLVGAAGSTQGLTTGNAITLSALSGSAVQRQDLVAAQVTGSGLAGAATFYQNVPCVPATSTSVLTGSISFKSDLVATGSTTASLSSGGVTVQQDVRTTAATGLSGLVGTINGPVTAPLTAVPARIMTGLVGIPTVQQDINAYAAVTASILAGAVVVTAPNTAFQARATFALSGPTGHAVLTSGFNRLGSKEKDVAFSLDFSPVLAGYAVASCTASIQEISAAPNTPPENATIFVVATVLQGNIVTVLCGTGVQTSGSRYLVRLSAQLFTPTPVTIVGFFDVACSA